MAKSLNKIIVKKNYFTPGQKNDTAYDGMTRKVGGDQSKEFAAVHKADLIDGGEGNGDDVFKGTNIKHYKFPIAPNNESKEEYISEYNPKHEKYHLNKARDHLSQQSEHHYNKKNFDRLADDDDDDDYPYEPKQSDEYKEAHADMKDEYKGLAKAHGKISDLHTKLAHKHMKKHLECQSKDVKEEIDGLFENIDEASQKKLINYINKSVDNLRAGGGASTRKYINRSVGVSRAARKLTGVKHFEKDDKHLGRTASVVPATK